ncbi:MAG: hypothetical protein AAGA26_12665 [Pseudomonadota bacterium]
MVPILEILVYVILFFFLRFVWVRMTARGQDRQMTLVFAGAVGVMVLVILSGVDWGYVLENWRDLMANALIAAAVISLIIGYARLIKLARDKAAKKDAE